MSIKIIATDLDGTLMAPDHTTVTSRTKEALRKAHESGVKIAIATGRTLGFITPVTEQIPFVDYVIFSNGASVYDCNAEKIVYRNHISAEDTADFLKKLDGLSVYYNVYSDGRVYLQKNKQQYYTNDELPPKFLELFMAAATPCENLSETLSGKSAEIVAVYTENKELTDEIRAYFEAKNLLVTASLKDEIEATSSSADKGTALSGLCRLLNISPCEAMAFGDAMNDMPMINFAEHSFAMENGCNELKSTAKFICPSNAEDGLAQMVEKYVLG